MEDRLLTPKGIDRIWQAHTTFSSVAVGLDIAKAQDAKTLKAVRDNLQSWVAAEKKKIDEDARYHYAPAQVQINAPLALIQLGMEARMSLLCQMESQIAALLQSGERGE